MSEARVERRLVTAMFIDIVGSTELTLRLGPERWRRHLAAAFDEIEGLIVREGGTLEKYVGDAIFALFGAPVAHADDAVRALRAADACIRWAASGTASAQPLAVRIGVETGEALIDLRAAEVERQQMSVGACVNIAARLQQNAEPSEVLVGPTCRSASADAAEFAATAPMALKGLRDVEAWRLVSVAPMRRVTEPPFVGHDAELELLGVAHRRARAGRVVLAIVSGPPGQGKTRLVQEYIRRSGVELRVLLARCRPGGEVGARTPVRQVIEADGCATAAEVGTRCVALFSDPTEAERVARTLAHSAGLAVDKYLVALGPVERQDEISSAWRRYVSALAREHASLLWIEDIHWAEPELVRLIDRMTMSGDAPLLVVATARPEFADQSRLRPSGDRFFISLDPLEPTHARALAESLGGGTAVARAEGNPLFIIELCRARPAATSGDLPITLLGVIGARLDELPSAEREMLQRAAVIGERFTARDVAVLSGRDTADAASALERLAASQYVQPSGDAYRFHHALVHDVAYARLPIDERMRLHARFARDGAHPEDVDTLAYHWWEALRPPDAEWVWEGSADLRSMRDEAFRVHVGAAARHAQRFGQQRAVDLYTRALTLASEPRDEAEVHWAIASLYTRNLEGDAGWEAFERALDAYRVAHVDPPAKFYADMVELPITWIGSLARLPETKRLLALFEAGDARATATGDESQLVRLRLRRAELQDEPALLDEADVIAASLPAGAEKTSALGDLAEVRAGFGHVRSAEHLLRQIDQLTGGGVSTDGGYMTRSVVSLQTLDLRELAVLAAGHRRLNAAAGPHLRSHAMMNTAALQFFSGDWPALVGTASLVRELVSLHPGTVFCPGGVTVPLHWAACAEAVAGRRDAAQELMAEASSVVTPTQNAALDAVPDRHLALCYALLGRRSDVRRIYTALSAVQNRVVRLRHLTLLAEALIVLGMWDELDDALIALDQAAELGSRYFAAIAEAAREERAAAHGGPQPRHAILREAGFNGVSQILSQRPR